MAGENVLSSLDGNFKKQFHNKVEELIPQFALLQTGLIDFVPGDKMNGDFYAIPTLLRSNQGVTYAGESGSVISLKQSRAGQMKEAQVRGSEVNVRGQLSYKTLSQSINNERAFKKASAWLVEDLSNVAYTRLEIAALHGRDKLGIVQSVADLGGLAANLVITDAEFAPGIWVPLEGASLDSFDAAGTTKTSTNGAMVISLVTTSTRTIKVSYVTALQTAAGHTLFFEGANQGAGSYFEMAGLVAQFSATTGVLFNIDRGAYTLMQGNVYSATGKPSKAKIVAATMLAVDKGCMSNVVALVSTATWASLNADDMALRNFDSSYTPSKSETGTKELLIDNVNGQIKVICHPMVKKGQILIFNPDDVMWIGSSKPTFEIPGMSEKFFRLVQDANAVELQNYADLAIYARKPCQTVIMTGVTP